MNNVADWTEVRHALDDVADELGLYENALLLEIAKRLKLGADLYGDLTEEKIDKKDWLKEAIEENLDQIVYITLQTMKMRRMNNG